VAGKIVVADAVKFRLIQPEFDGPTAPTGLKPGEVGIDRVQLIWDASQDSSGVGGYIILRDGMPVGSSVTASYVDQGLRGANAYEYAVAAYDIYGNYSGLSTPVTVATVSAVPEIIAVTGGGWVTQPDGGKKSFIVGMKYVKNRPGKPLGQFQFEDRALGLKLRCNLWDWFTVDEQGLVATFKGSGTVNGVGNFDFLVKAEDNSGTDGAKDTLSITITPCAGYSFPKLRVTANSPLHNGVYAVSGSPLDAGNIEIHMKKDN
jgi:hypothetical protein